MLPGRRRSTYLGTKAVRPQSKGGQRPLWPEPREEKKIVPRELLRYGLEASAPEIVLSTRWWQRSPIEPSPFRGRSSIHPLTGIISATLERCWWCCNLPLPWTPPPRRTNTEPKESILLQSTYPDVATFRSATVRSGFPGAPQ